MTTIKINAITVPAESGDELAHRFAARAGAVDGAEGFEGFELLKPTDERDQWLVVTRWRDEESFQAWMGSAGFAQGHRGAGAPTGEGPAGAAGAGSTPGAGAAARGAEGDAEPAQRPVSTRSELWSYEVAGGSAPRD